MIKEFKSTIEPLEEYSKLFQEFINEETNDKSFDLNLHYYFITVVLKNVDSINSLVILFKHSSFEGSYYSIGLLLRSICLDCITGLFIANQIEPNKNDEEQTKIRKQITALHIDQIFRTIKYVKLENPLKSLEDKERFCDIINTRYEHFLNEPITPQNLEPKFIESKKMPSVKHQVENSRVIEISKSLYSSYIFYSKFEHTGFDTHKFYERILAKDSREIEVNQIFKLLHNFILINKMFAVFFKVTNELALEEIKSKSDEIMSKLKNL